MLINKIKKIDQSIFGFFHHYGHWIHRLSLGMLFIWFGLLKPLGHKTTTSLLAHTVYWGEPETMVLILGWWEVAIGICIIIKPLIRIALLLLIIRLPGIILAFILKTEVCFYEFPFAPTPEGQFLIKDLVIFVATLAIAGTLYNKDTLPQHH